MSAIDVILLERSFNTAKTVANVLVFFLNIYKTEWDQSRKRKPQQEDFQTENATAYYFLPQEAAHPPPKMLAHGPPLPVRSASAIAALSANGNGTRNVRRNDAESIADGDNAVMSDNGAGLRGSVRRRLNRHVRRSTLEDIPDADEPASSNTNRPNTTRGLPATNPGNSSGRRNNNDHHLHVHLFTPPALAPSNPARIATTQPEVDGIDNATKKDKNKKKSSSSGGLFKSKPIPVVDVLAANNEIVYTFEQVSRSSHTWLMYTYPDRAPVATLTLKHLMKVAGKTAHTDALHFHSKRGINIRKIRRKSTVFDSYRMFYTLDGAPYQWSRNTKHLEKVINMGGKEEEVRKVVGKAKLLRRGKLDYEVLLDEKQVDKEVALATAFASILTQWDRKNAPLVTKRTEISNNT